MFRLMLCSVVLIFGATYTIEFLSISYSVCKIFEGIILDLCLFEMENEYFLEAFRFGCNFLAAEFLFIVIVSIVLL